MAGGAAAKPFITHHNALGCDFFLRISLELHLKRLLVGGWDRVFEIGRNFRNEGLSRKHNPEFTMLEVYQAYSDHRGMMALIRDLLTTLCRDVLGTFEIKHAASGQVINFAGEWREVKYKDLVIAETGDPQWFARSKAEKAAGRGKARPQDRAGLGGLRDHQRDLFQAASSRRSSSRPSCSTCRRSSARSPRSTARTRRRSTCSS